MLKHRKKIGSISMFLGAALLIYSCGGGGGGGGTPAVGTAGTRSSATATKSIVTTFDAALSGMEIGTNPLSKPSVKKAGVPRSDAAQVLQAIERFKGSVGSRQKTLRKIDTIALDCTTGAGDITIDDNGTLENNTDDSFTLTASNCLLEDPEGTSTLNGSFSGTSTPTGFNVTFTNFLARETEGAKRTESLLNGTISFSGTEFDCNEKVFLERGTLTVNLTGSDKVDATGDGTFEMDESFEMKDFTMALAETFTPAPACVGGATTITLNGSATETDVANGDDTYSATYNGFTMTLTPATRTIGGVATPGVTVALNGNVTLDSQCTDGTFALSTPGDNLPFVPEDESCPVSGQILVSSGAATSAVNFTATGGVQIDDGNNGSVDREFSDCEEGEVCDA